MKPPNPQTEEDFEGLAANAKQTYNYFANNHTLDGSPFRGMTGLDENMYMIAHYGSITGASPSYPRPDGTEGPTLLFSNLATAQADDVVAHEYMHRVTIEIADMVYKAKTEHGALQESIADMFGQMVDWSGGEVYDDPDDVWIYGEDKSGGSGLRNLQYPTRDRYSDYNPVGVNHTNGGITSKLFYLLIAGTAADSEPSSGYFNGFSFSGLDEDFNTAAAMAADLVFDSIKNYLLPVSGFRTFGWILQQTAIDLSFSSANREIVRKACLAVEIVERGFLIEDASGIPLVQITTQGDLVFFLKKPTGPPPATYLVQSGDPKPTGLTEFLVFSKSTNKWVMSVQAYGLKKGQVIIDSLLHSGQTVETLQSKVSAGNVFAIKNWVPDGELDDFVAVLESSGALWIRGVEKTPDVVN